MKPAIRLIVSTITKTHHSFLKFIKQANFPCIMAKSLIGHGHLSHYQTTSLECKNAPKVLLLFYKFLEQYHKQGANKLSSLVITLRSPEYLDFNFFEQKFWPFLAQLRKLDQAKYRPDPRVSNDPNSPNFSFSIGGEAFFILALHPQAKRRARRFPYPTLVFNPHQQFEDLRKQGIFKKVRDLIRRREAKLEGKRNPMLSDFGEKSEVFQYLGVSYPENSPSPLRF